MLPLLRLNIFKSQLDKYRSSRRLYTYSTILAMLLYLMLINL